MSLVETIRLWQEGVCAADGKEWGVALGAFTAVQNPPAKISFNIGCIHLVLGKLAEAEEVRSSCRVAAPRAGTGEFARRAAGQTEAVGKGGINGRELTKGRVRGLLKLG